MKVIEVVGNILEEASGPAHSVPALCQALAHEGADVELHVNLGKKPENAVYRFYEHGRSNLLKNLWRSPDMYQTLKRRAQTFDIIHTHGLWVMPYIYPGWAVRGTNCQLMISPRGTLSEYALNRSIWLKKVIWAFAQRNVLKDSACLHATAELEYREIRRMGLRNPVAIIPNGINIPPVQRQEKGRQHRRRLFFLSRIHPKKGVDYLLHAWSVIEKQYTEWELQIAGPDNNGYLFEMQSLARHLRVNRVAFSGALYGYDKSQAYWSADLFVLPTNSENFGLVVAEALAHGVPVIVSKGAPWEGVETHDCGWWIDIGVEPLVACLRKVLAESPDNLYSRGRKGRKWMQEEFSWTSIGKKMFETYRWLIKGGQTPEWVRLD